MPDLTPVYVTEEPNKLIILSEAEKVEVIIQGAAYEGNAEVLLRFLPRPALLIKAAFPDLAADLYNVRPDKVILRFPSLGAESEVLPTSVAPAPNTVVPLTITFTPTHDLIVIGDSNARTLHKVRFHLINFCNFYSDKHNDSGNRILEDHLSGSWRVLGCATLIADGWRITISALPSSGDLVKELSAIGGYGITHVGQMEHLDGGAFDGNVAEDLLNSLHFFLSFARGFQTPPVLPVGLDQNNQKVWEQWGIGQADSWKCALSWFDEHNGQLLAEVFPGFWRLWCNDSWQTALRGAVWWYLESNSNAGDRGIMMTQVALELLSWTLAVREKRLISAEAFRKLPASDKLRLILSSLNIPIDIPSELTVLAWHAKNFHWSDGPHAFAEIRNETVHPHHKKKGQLLEAKFECWKLGQWYLELIILALCGHTGKYSTRLAIQRPGEVTAVPWAAETIS